MIAYKLCKKAKSDDVLELEWKRFRGREREREGFNGAFRGKKKKKKSQQSRDHYFVSQNGFN
jgi:hypothetical protein